MDVFDGLARADDWPRDDWMACDEPLALPDCQYHWEEAEAEDYGTPLLSDSSGSIVQEPPSPLPPPPVELPTIDMPLELRLFYRRRMFADDVPPAASLPQPGPLNVPLAIIAIWRIVHDTRYAAIAELLCESAVMTAVAIRMPIAFVLCLNEQLPRGMPHLAYADVRDALSEWFHGNLPAGDRLTIETPGPINLVLAQDRPNVANLWMLVRTMSLGLPY